MDSLEYVVESNRVPGEVSPQWGDVFSCPNQTVDARGGAKLRGAITVPIDRLRRALDNPIIVAR